MNPEDLKNCALFTIWLGANDASLAEQKVELPEYRNNLSQMITYLSSDLGLSSERIVLINPPPIDETKEDPDKPKIRTLENTRLYAKACIEVAKANGVECVDMFNALLNQEVRYLALLGSYDSYSHVPPLFVLASISQLSCLNLY
uniref:Isoamyl acetate-hydrolyzing esterase 1 homolog n=2 Tax=Schistocephalus solidus TaxID=70667 RepID=A0A0X3QGR5_SCHSO